MITFLHWSFMARIRSHHLDSRLTAAPNGTKISERKRIKLAEWRNSSRAETNELNEIRFLLAQANSPRNCHCFGMEFLSDSIKWKINQHFPFVLAVYVILEFQFNYHTCSQLEIYFRLDLPLIFLCLSGIVRELGRLDFWLSNSSNQENNISWSLPYFRRLMSHLCSLNFNLCCLFRHLYNAPSTSSPDSPRRSNLSANLIVLNCEASVFFWWQLWKKVDSDWEENSRHAL